MCSSSIKTRVLLPLLLALALFVLCQPGPLQAESVSKMVYARSSGTSSPGQLTLWLGPRNLKMELVDERQTLSMIYRSQEKPPVLYLLDPEAKKARKITREDVKTVAKFLREKYAQMQNMMQEVPPAQRQQMKQAMPFDSQPDPTPPPEPRLEVKRSVTWQGRSAQEASVQVGSDSAGRMVILDSPILEITSNQENVLKSYQSLLDEWIGLLGSLPNREDSRDIRSPANRLGGYFTRMAEYEHENTRLVLKEWTTTSSEGSLFQVPDSYRVESIGSMVEGGSSR